MQKGLFHPQSILPYSLLLLSLAATGCGEQAFPRDMVFPVRTDLVIELGQEIKAQTFYADPPGRLDESIRALVQKEPTITYYDPRKLSADQRKQLASALRDAFGTPAQPTIVFLGEDNDGGKVDAAVKLLKLDDEHLASGSRHYRKHCLQCHGVPGDGRGPTAAWVHPHPRDYRSGKFKFVSTQPFPGSKPRREDLLRTLHKGVEGTSMPSFALLPEQELQDLVSYVMFLSIRGQAEFDTIAHLLRKDAKLRSLEKNKEWEEGGLDDEEYLPDSDKTPATIETNVQSALKQAVVNQWMRSESKQIKPQEVKELAGVERLNAVERGYQQYVKAGCLKCHIDNGRQAQFKYDAWGTPVRPANLTVPTYRGGRRPIDLYWRLRGGIVPSGMANIDPNFKDADLWDLIAFLQAMPYAETLPSKVREKIYGPMQPAKGEEQKPHH